MQFKAFIDFLERPVLEVENPSAQEKPWTASIKGLKSTTEITNDKETTSVS